jgi:hypothetical protein
MADKADATSLGQEQRYAHRDRLYDAVERMELEYDKALLVLQPLGISVTSALLVALWNNHAKIDSYFFIYLSWILWILGIAATLASFRLSAKLQTQAVVEWIENRDPHNKHTIKVLGCIVEYLNWASGGLFVAGILSAGLFLSLLPH